LNKKFISIAASIVWAAIVFYLHAVRVSLPKDNSLIQIPHLDKVAHCLMFAVFAFILVRMLQAQTGKRVTTAQWLIVLLFCSFYGAFMEYLQAILPSQRDSDVLDWVADLIGSCLGIFLALRNVLPSVFEAQGWK